ncbi:MAG TPA: hypothetical protein VIO61_14605 [Anaerolineaceae bacterium]
MPGKSIADLNPVEKKLLERSMTWMDQFWDESMGLLWGQGDRFDPLAPLVQTGHTVRDSSWYALGLLMRDSAGDRQRAEKAIEAILTYQFSTPGLRYFGTFRRSPEEPFPPPDAREWKDYDPNWREFIGTTLAVILLEYEARLSPELVAKIDRAFPLMIQGALERRLNPAYTNIALMNAFLLWYVGSRQHREDWVAAGEQMAVSVYSLFSPHRTFAEYNSPTYYGVDIFALALWREYAGSSIIRDAGVKMEAWLWEDIARFYHARMRNLCGPFDRSYGMDMRKYVAVVGEWIALITGMEDAPLPPGDQPFWHAHDLCFAPLAVMLGARVPEEVRSHFLEFQGERLVERVIVEEPQRVATAWLADTIMAGAEETSGTKNGYSQFHPVVIYWLASGTEVGWVRLLHREPVDARAAQRNIKILAHGEVSFQVYVPGVHDENFQPRQWILPGLVVKIYGTPGNMTLTNPEPGLWLVTYAVPDGMIQMIDMELSAG